MKAARVVSALVWSAAVFGIGALVAIGSAADDGLAALFGPSESVSASIVASAAATDPGPTPVVDGCAHPRQEWLWCDDFERDRTARYFEYVDHDGSFSREVGAGRNGSTSMRARWTRGQVDAGSLKLVFGRNPIGRHRLADSGTAEYRELYWRVYVRSQPGWQPNGNDKFTRAIVFAGPDWQEAAIGHVWGGGAGAAQAYYVLDPASGVDASGALVTTHYNDFAHLTWLGAAPARTALLGSDSGGWHCIEAHMRLNDPGMANGVLELWIDERLDAQRTGLNWVGDYRAFGINALFLEGYINDGAPRPQVRDYDDLVVSTARIGCDAPSGLPR